MAMGEALEISSDLAMQHVGLRQVVDSATARLHRIEAELLHRMDNEETNCLDLNGYTVLRAVNARTGELCIDVVPSP